MVSAQAQRVTVFGENSCEAEGEGGGDFVVEIEGCRKVVVIFVSIFSSSFFSKGKEMENGT